MSDVEPQAKPSSSSSTSSAKAQARWRAPAATRCSGRATCKYPDEPLNQSRAANATCERLDVTWLDAAGKCL